MESLYNQIANVCIHYNGLMSDTCKAGISRTKESDGFPCFRGGSLCSKYEWPTEEYITNTISEINKHISFDFLNNVWGKCEIEDCLAWME